MGGLKYVGRDLLTDWLPGVPARDLTADEVEQYPEAAQSKLYEEIKPPVKAGKEQS